MGDKAMEDESSSARQPHTVLEIVSQILGEIRQLKQDTPTIRAAGESLHALAGPLASRLGLYSLDLVPPRPVSLSQKSISENFALISRSAIQLRALLESADTRTMMQELTTQASELTYATQGPNALTMCLKDAWKSFPRILWTGALSQNSVPSANHADAVAVLDAFCQAMTPTATNLHLQCFHERTEMPDADAPFEKIMTFTSGGRIIVLDLELGLCRKDDQWTPNVGLNISYATGDTSVLSEYNKRLENMMCAWLQQLMHVLFGLDVDPTVLARCQPCQEDTALEKALNLWDSFVSSLATLALIDGIMVESIQGSKDDLFQRLASLCALADDVCGREAHTLALQHGKEWDASVNVLEQPDMVELLQRYGHGVSLCHHHTPYLCLAFTSQHTATVRISPISIPFAFHQDANTMAVRPVTDMPPEAYQLWHAQGHHVEHASQPLAYLAQVSPPMAVPHSMACAVYSACGLASQQLITTHHETQSGFLAQNLLSSSYKASLCDEETREISALPFLCLAQCYRAIEILQECDLWTRVLSGVKNDTSTRPVCTLQLDPGVAPDTLCLRLHTTAAHTPATMIHATLWPMLTNRTGWDWEAEAKRWDGTVIGTTRSSDMPPSADEMRWPDEFVLVRIRDILDAWVDTLS